MEEVHLLSRETEVFLTAAQTRSFSRTASALGLTQPAVTRIISRLEQRLGVELFDRTRRPLQITDEAEVLYRELSVCRQGLERAVEAVRTRSFLKPAVKFGVIDLFVKDLAPELIAMLLPKVSDVALVTGTSRTLISAVLERKIDFALVSGAFSEIRGLSRTFLFREPSVLALPKRLADRLPRPVSWDDLLYCGLPYLRFIREGGGGRANENYFNSLNIRPQGHVELDSNAAMVSLIHAGIGWTVARVTTLLQNPELLSEIEILPLPSESPVLNRELYLTARKDDTNPLTGHSAEKAREIFSERISPKIKQIAPWANFT